MGQRLYRRSARVADVNLELERAFVLAHTAIAPVPLVPDIALHTATAVTPLWQATEAWLDAQNVAIPFWSVPWAGGTGLARFILDFPGIVADKRVLDFACGSGLVGIAAMRAGARAVEAVDIDRFAIAATLLNAAHNGVVIAARAEDIVGDPLSDIDVVLAGDIFYESAPATRFTAWLSSITAHVIAGDPGRHHVPALRELARYEVPTTLDLESVASRTTRILELTPPR